MILLLKLLIAHLITDFFIQPNSWIEDKKHKKGKSKYLFLHVFITGFVAFGIMAKLEYWWIAAIITASHYMIDWFKLAVMGDSLKSFLVDQILHLTVIGFCVLSIGSAKETFLEYLQTIDVQNALIIITAFLSVTLPSGYLVGKVTARWRDELTTTEQERDSLKNAGIWIGVLERVLVLVFVLLNQMQAIGFLIAAKSILRFSDKNEFNPRKQTEYVLIGTLLSFSIALIVGILMTRLTS